MSDASRYREELSKLPRLTPEQAAKAARLFRRPNAFGKSDGHWLRPVPTARHPVLLSFALAAALRGRDNPARERETAAGRSHLDALTSPSPGYDR